jgi:S-adenosylmethionine hydrolase
MAIITLLSDFGYADEYAGVLKGVIYGINPAATIVDLTHGIAPQDVVQAAQTLAAAFAYFPTGTIHVAVVDPGVGGRRAIIAARQHGQIILAPDNGLISLVWDLYPPEIVVVVENQKFFLSSPSRTFHGRDIFAPVAAHLSLGLALTALGPALNAAQAVRLSPAQAQIRPGPVIEGAVEAVDHFGNLITNVHDRLLRPMIARGDTRAVVQIGERCIVGLSGTYAEADPGRLLALINSRGRLEIALRDGSAAQALSCGKGTMVQIRFDPCDVVHNDQPA